MNIGTQMHQQFLKEFIHSLQAGSEDGHSQSQSESSLNPNAAEFVPSYLKADDCDDNKESKPNEKKTETCSTTTLVNKELIGDAKPLSRKASQNRVQRQLVNLMTTLGNQSLPLTEIRFSQMPNGQGVNVQFITPEGPTKKHLDEKLCLAAGICIEMSKYASQSTRPSNVLASQFLGRMSEALGTHKKDNNDQQLCPKCISLPDKRSYTEMEIEQQIEDIKVFENLISEDEGVRYQEAFKELCQKLGLTKNGVGLPKSEFASTNATSSDAYVDDDGRQLYRDDNEHAYTWDAYTPELTIMQAYRYATPSMREIHVNDLREKPHPAALSQDEFRLNVPPGTPAISVTKTNVSSPYPKLYKVNPHKYASASCPRKPAVSKEKETKTQRYRYNMLHPTATTRTGTTSGAAKGAATGVAMTLAKTTTAKKSTETPLLSRKRSKSLQRDAHPKVGASKSSNEGTVNHVPKVTTHHKTEARPHTTILKQHHPEQLQVNKPKVTSQGRVSGAGQTQSSKSGTGNHRVTLPRSTHASEMRQSEVKRRLNLLRSENDSDVQFIDYIFK